MRRDQQIYRMHTEEFDLCIIGAGASGAGSALDAALRGMKVLLIDASDFAAGTSSRSTKLIHGGVRYLEQAFKNLDFAQLRQVRHGLEERHNVLANAPHLARPLALITPVFSWIEGLYFAIGLKIYSWFASKKDTLPPGRWLSRAEAMARIPGLHPRLHSAVLYYDGQLDDARYALALVQSAQEAGAVVVNYMQLKGFNHTDKGRLYGAQVKDTLSGNEYAIKARYFLNCTGPYADTVRLLANPALHARIKPAKGVHAIFPWNVLGSADALLIPKTPDGRVVFAIPFGNTLLLGTTDEAYQGGAEEPILEQREVSYLLDTLRPYTAQSPDISTLKAGFGGIRPLITASGKATKGLLRDHEVEHDAVSGLYSLLGGKWTTYRIMARDAVDALAKYFPDAKPCSTEQYVLAGGLHFHPDDWQRIVQETGLDMDIGKHLLANYGSRWPLVVTILNEQAHYSRRLLPELPFIEAEVVYAARYEMCCTIRDFLARRIRLEISDWSQAYRATEQVAELLGQELGWDAKHIAHEADAYRQLLDQFTVAAITHSV